MLFKDLAAIGSLNIALRPQEQTPKPRLQGSGLQAGGGIPFEIWSPYSRLNIICTSQDLKRPELMYKALGCKLAVGMPFKDLATSDSLFLRDVPAADDKEARTALNRLAVSLICPSTALSMYCRKSWPCFCGTSQRRMEARTQLIRLAVSSQCRCDCARCGSNGYCI